MRDRNGVDGDALAVVGLAAGLLQVPAHETGARVVQELEAGHRDTGGVQRHLHLEVRVRRPERRGPRADEDRVAGLRRDAHLLRPVLQVPALHRLAVLEVGLPSHPRDVVQHPARHDAVPPSVDRVRLGALVRDQSGVDVVVEASPGPGEDVAQGIDVGVHEPVVRDADVVDARSRVHGHPVVSRHAVPALVRDHGPRRQRVRAGDRATVPHEACRCLPRRVSNVVQRPELVVSAPSSPVRQTRSVLLVLLHSRRRAILQSHDLVLPCASPRRARAW